MSIADVAVEMLLIITLTVSVFSCLALVMIKDFFNRLHYLAPVTTVGTVALVAAVVVKEGWGQSAIKTVFVFLILLLVNAVLTHATARAARVRKFGDWVPTPEEYIEGASGSE